MRKLNILLWPFLILIIIIWNSYYYFIIQNNEIIIVIKLFSILLGSYISFLYLKKYEWWKEIIGWVFYAIVDSVLCGFIYFMTYSFSGLTLNLITNEKDNILIEKCKIIRVVNSDHRILDKVTYLLDNNNYSFVMTMPNGLSNDNKHNYYLSTLR